MVGLQCCAQPRFDRPLHDDDPFPVPAQRGNLRRRSGDRAQRPPMPVLMSDGVGQNECVESIRFRVGHPIPFPRPGRVLRRHAVHRGRQRQQELHQQPLGPLDRDHYLSAGCETSYQGADFGQSDAGMRGRSLHQDDAVCVNDAHLVMTTAPIDPDEHIPVITGVGEDPDYGCSFRS